MAFVDDVDTVLWSAHFCRTSDFLLASTARWPVIYFSVPVYIIYVYGSVHNFLLPDVERKLLGRLRWNLAGGVVLGCSCTLEKIGPFIPALPGNISKPSKMGTTCQTLRLLELSSEDAKVFSVTYLVVCAQSKFFSVFSERELMFAICYRPSVCRLSVTFVHPT